LPHIFFTALVAVVFIAVASACMMLTLWFLKRGVLAVLRIFHEHNAVGEENARSFHELGLRPKTFADYFNPGLRDYRQEGLQLLMANNIVRMTADNRLYLAEELYPY
jgi:hypothetical protein